jgi:hypothetical protein
LRIDIQRFRKELRSDPPVTVGRCVKGFTGTNLDVE